jgi:hypothetical protein
MPANPRLKQVNPSSPLRPLVDDLNHAIGNQSRMRPGTGFGMTGNSIRRTSQDWMVAFTDPDGVPAATWKDPADHKKGRKLGPGIAFEQTYEVDANGDVWLVPAGPDDVTEIPCFNYAVESDVQGSTLVILEKQFGLWVVVWEECSGQS